MPKAIPYAAMPDVALPEQCRTTSPRTVRELPGSWLNRRTHACADGLAGRTIAIQYPIVSPGQGTLLRVELLSGVQLVHMLNPGEDSWQVPEERAGLLEAPWTTIRSAVLDGVTHLADGWLHLALLLAICLLGGTPTALGLVTAFAVGQLLGVGVSAGLGTGLPSPLAEGGIAVAVVLLARDALRPPADRRSMAGVAVAAGVVHALGISNLMPAPSSFGDHGWALPGIVRSWGWMPPCWCWLSPPKLSVEWLGERSWDRAQPPGFSATDSVPAPSPRRSAWF